MENPWKMNRRRWIAATAGGLMYSGLRLKGNPLNSLLEKPGASSFGPDFTWGTATAAFQVEGATTADGKIPSIWDTFTARKKSIKDGSNATEACDFYHRYPKDLELARQIGGGAFRFSLAWTRIINADGSINQKGADHYSRLTDNCLSLGIEPWVTLYHWNLPQHLQDEGGWKNRSIVGHFTRYAEVCGTLLGDRVKNWMVLNEPLSFTSLGYLLGMHAPGKKGLASFLPAVHHAALCQADGARALRQTVQHANIGTCFSCSPVDPFRETEKDRAAAIRVDALVNRLFIEPALGMGYPVETLPVLTRMEKYFKKDDAERLAFDFDFIGLQNYFRLVCRHNALVPHIAASEVPATERTVPVNEMGFEINPEGMGRMIHKFDAYPGVRNVIVTENGVCVPDTVENGRVKDVARIAYLETYLAAILKAKKNGAKVNGYFAWSLLDNFEWAEGYRPRFGLVHVNYQTQERIIKDSGYWFRDFLKR